MEEKKALYELEKKRQADFQRSREQLALRQREQEELERKRQADSRRAREELALRQKEQEEQEMRQWAEFERRREMEEENRREQERQRKATEERERQSQMEMRRQRERFEEERASQAVAMRRIMHLPSYGGGFGGFRVDSFSSGSSHIVYILLQALRRRSQSHLVRVGLRTLTDGGHKMVASEGARVKHKETLFGPYLFPSAYNVCSRIQTLAFIKNGGFQFTRPMTHYCVYFSKFAKMTFFCVKTLNTE